MGKSAHACPAYKRETARQKHSDSKVDPYRIRALPQARGLTGIRGPVAHGWQWGYATVLGRPIALVKALSLRIWDRKFKVIKCRVCLQLQLLLKRIFKPL